jgi:hypothetical protein
MGGDRCSSVVSVSYLIGVRDVPFGRCESLYTDLRVSYVIC